MARTPDLTTLRYNNLNFKLPSKNNKLSIENLLLLRSIENCLVKKDISVSRSNFVRCENKCLLNLELFYRTKKIMRYNLFLKECNLVRLKPILPIKNAILQISIVNLNSFLHRKSIIKCYNTIKRFSGSLFVRRFSLFLDFIKLTSLIIDTRVSVDLYVVYLGYIFRFIQKKKHGKFIFFIKNLFNYIILFSDIKGIRFEISGRISGKPRSKTVNISKGSLQAQSFCKKIEYSKTHVYTLYGAFGLKLWLNKD